MAEPSLSKDLADRRSAYCWALDAYRFAKRYKLDPPPGCSRTDLENMRVGYLNMGGMLVDLPQIEPTRLSAAALATLRNDYLWKREVYRNLVGKTFPSVLHGEIERMAREYVAAGGKATDLPATPPPLMDGSAPSFEKVLPYPL